MRRRIFIKPKMMVKMGIDLAMTVLLLCQMSYLLIGEMAHEWMGTAMFVLFLLHHALNREWYQNLGKGRYSALRIFQTAVDFLVFLAMLGLMISGIMMSRVVFSFLPVSGGMGFARSLHMLSAYWGFLLMGVHIGLHWGMIMGMARRMFGVTKTSSIRSWVLRAVIVVICVFGIFTFGKHNLADYMFLRTQFVFFDTEQPLVLFLAEYLSMLGLWICVGWRLRRTAG